jgi:lipid A disaccharide synthetase
MPELLQENATPEKVFSIASSILKNPEKMEKMMADLKNLQLKLKGSGASNKVAAHILELN